MSEIDRNANEIYEIYRSNSVLVPNPNWISPLHSLISIRMLANPKSVSEYGTTPKGLRAFERIGHDGGRGNDRRSERVLTFYRGPFPLSFSLSPCRFPSVPIPKFRHLFHPQPASFPNHGRLLVFLAVRS